MGGKITEFILIRASLFDAILVTIIVLPFIYLFSLKNKSWLIIVIGIVVAILNEWYGLSTGRWTYNSLMPIVPMIKVGLTPTFQLGVLGYITYRFQKVIVTPTRGKGTYKHKSEYGVLTVYFNNSKLKKIMDGLIENFPLL